MNTPMTAHRLAECRALAAAHRQCFAPATADAIEELVAEVDRLQAAVNFLRECNEDTGRIAERAEAEVEP